MTKSAKNRIWLASGAAALLGLGLVAGPALAQRDPAYAAARSAGQVGEKMDGYLGVVGSGNAQLRAMVDDINIRRRAVYAEQAQAKGATLEEYAFTAGCLAISRTEPGEMYVAYSNGQWTARTGSSPDRDPRCP